MEYIILASALTTVVLSVYGFCRFIGLCDNVERIRRSLETGAREKEKPAPHEDEPTPPTKPDFTRKLANLINDGMK